MKRILVLLTAICLTFVLLAVPTALGEESAPAIESASPEASASIDANADEPAAAEETAVEEGETEEEYTGIYSASRLITIGILLLAMIAALVISTRRVRWNASMIAKAAICVALAYLLSMIRIFRMPMGGSVTLVSMLPLILFAYAFGPLEGVLIGCVYGLLQLLIDPYVIHPIQLLVDYPMAYAAVALACLAKSLPMKQNLKLPMAVLLGYLGRYIMAVLSGVIFFAEYAGEQNALIYSLIYNISYLGPEALVCCVVTFIPGMSRLPEILRQNAHK